MSGDERVLVVRRTDTTCMVSVLPLDQQSGERRDKSNIKVLDSFYCTAEVDDMVSANRNFRMADMAAQR